ncbi:Zn(II)2Cys6 transcription factor domain-containing protein [Aspergillus stella-maris]|uniref:Zn(II)2Cys6 transcription factor domain-containing protein n=1 Tax=Aspergillus stella-maris TaxID=1810926 RepID=UPI003CCCCBFA
MVGVPGKSKGCGTCRRRKKGCDLQRPACGQCRKSSLFCTGYERATIWVNMDHETGLELRYTTAHKETQPQLPAPVNLPSNYSHSHDADNEITLLEPLARFAYHEQYLGVFWTSYLPNG